MWPHKLIPFNRLPVEESTTPFLCHSDGHYVQDLRFVWWPTIVWTCLCCLLGTMIKSYIFITVAHLCMKKGMSHFKVGARYSCLFMWVNYGALPIPIWIVSWILLPIQTKICIICTPDVLWHIIEVILNMLQCIQWSNPALICVMVCDVKIANNINCLWKSLKVYIWWNRLNPLFDQTQYKIENINCQGGVP